MQNTCSILIPRKESKNWKKTPCFSFYNYLVKKGAPISVNETHFPGVGDEGEGTVVLSFELKRYWSCEKIQAKDGVIWEFQKYKKSSSDNKM